MKVCFTALEGNLQSKIDPRFGRSNYFIFYDTETKKEEVVGNPYTDGGGAGTKASQLMINNNIKLVISGDLGPNAQFALNQAKIAFKKADLTKLVEENINTIL